MLTEELRGLAAQCNEISGRLTGCQCNICVNYGGRAELVHAAQRFARDCLMGLTEPAGLTEEAFEGMTLARWTAEGKISSLQEFGCNQDRYDPYEKGPEPRFRDEQILWF